MADGTPQKNILDRFNLRRREKEINRIKKRRQITNTIQTRNNDPRKVNRRKILSGVKRSSFSPYDLQLPNNTVLYDDKIVTYDDKIVTYDS